MRIFQKRNYDGSIRIVETKSGARIGVIGTVSDLLKEGFFEHYIIPEDAWAFISTQGEMTFSTLLGVVVDRAQRNEKILAEQETKTRTGSKVKSRTGRY